MGLYHSSILSAIILSLTCGARGVVKAIEISRNTNPVTMTTGTAVVNNVICQVSITELMSLSFDGVQNGGHRYDCLTVAGTAGPHEIHLHFASNSLLLHEENQKALVNEGWYISFPLDWVTDDGHLLPNETEQVTTLTLEEVDEALMLLQQYHGTRRNLQKNGSLRKRRTETNTNHDDRRLAAIGVRQCGIVIVHAQDRANPETVASVERAAYTTANNQFRACSNNAMSLNRKDATISVTLPRAIWSYDSISVYDAARVAVCTYYRQPSNCEPAAIRGLDHIMYSLPFGTSDDTVGNYWAYASIGGTRNFSIYNGNYFLPATIMHELGHNMYLGHAVEGADVYGDQTGQMGGGGSDARCFNGYNMYVLGWLTGQMKTIDTLNPGAIERFTLKSLADRGTGGYVNVKIGPFYLVYNMDKGLTSGTREYQDQILIHQAFGATLYSPHSDTVLQGTLSKVGDSLVINNFRGSDKAIVVVCSMDKVGSNGATIVVGLNRADCTSGFAVLQSTTTNYPPTHAGTESDTGSTNFVLHKHAAEPLPFTASTPMMERITPVHIGFQASETDISSHIIQVDASLSSRSTISVATITSANDLGWSSSSSFDIKCDNMWKDTVAIQGFVGDHTCEWVFETQGGAYCDSAIMMEAADGQQEPVKKKCQVQCLQECAYAAVCRRNGDRCNAASSFGQCCGDTSCVDGICR